MKNKIIFISFCSLMFLFLCGCGHSIVRTDRGIGFHFRVPNPFQQGDSIVDFKLGNIDTTIAIIRGNTTFDSTSAKGGSLTGISGISERFAISSNPQLNEGYIAKILTSPNADKETKVEIAKYLASKDAPTISDAKSITIGAATGSGENSSKITLEKTGIDNIVDKTSETISNIRPTISNATKETITSIPSDVSDTSQHIAGETTEKLSDKISNHIFLSFIIAILITLILVFLIEWLVKKIKNCKYFNKDKTIMEMPEKPKNDESLDELI